VQSRNANRISFALSHACANRLCAERAHKSGDESESWLQQQGSCWRRFYSDEETLNPVTLRYDYGTSEPECSRPDLESPPRYSSVQILGTGRVTLS
jgi:hypothetical protein